MRWCRAAMGCIRERGQRKDRHGRKYITKENTHLAPNSPKRLTKHSITIPPLLRHFIAIASLAPVVRTSLLVSDSHEPCQCREPSPRCRRTFELALSRPYDTQQRRSCSVRTATRPVEGDTAKPFIISYRSSAVKCPRHLGGRLS